MYDQILFPTDGSDGAAAVSDRVFDLADTHDATVHVLNVADTTHDSVVRIGGQVVDALEQEGERIVRETARRAEGRDVDVVTAVPQGGVPETITGYAAEYDADLVVMPTHGRTGIERLLVGSVTETVVRRSSVPVLTMDPDRIADRQYPYRTLLVPTDGSAPAGAALELAVAIGERHGAAVHVLSVVDTTSLGVDVHSAAQIETLEERAERDVSEAVEAVEDASLDAVGTVERNSSVSGAICEYADEHDVDLVVMGTHGRTGFDRYVLGSVAEKTVRSAGVPVLTVPHRGGD